MRPGKGALLQASTMAGKKTVLLMIITEQYDSKEARFSFRRDFNHLERLDILGQNNNEQENNTFIQRHHLIACQRKQTTTLVQYQRYHTSAMQHWPCSLLLPCLVAAIQFGRCYSISNSSQTTDVHYESASQLIIHVSQC